MDLTEAQAENMTRISWHCARTSHPSAYRLTLDDRQETALDGIIEYVVDNGFPNQVNPLFRAGTAAIQLAVFRAGAPLRPRGMSYWVEPPAPQDAIAEAITDKIAVWEICWALSDIEWGAVWALAEAYRRGGGLNEAAAILGVHKVMLESRLAVARRRARSLWVAAGETPPRRMYHPNRNGTRSRYGWWQANQRVTTEVPA